MKRRHWKRLFIGWVLVNLLLSAPAAAYYTGDFPLGGPDIKPWMLVAELAADMLSGGGLGGCTPGP